jgi:hypothetical protein
VDDFSGEGGLLHSLSLCLGLFFLLFSLLGAVVCLIYRRLSAWLLLAMAGFLIEVFVGILRHVAASVLHHLDVSFDVIGIVYLALSAFYLVATALILIGFVMALGQIQQQMSRLRQEGAGPSPRLPPPQASEPFRERKEGSLDIQP